MVAEPQLLHLDPDFLDLVRFGSAEGVPVKGRRAFLLVVASSFWAAAAQFLRGEVAFGCPRAHSQGRPSLAQAKVP